MDCDDNDEIPIDDNDENPSSRLKEFERDSLLFHSVFQNVLASDNKDNTSTSDIPKNQYLFLNGLAKKNLVQGGYRFGIAEVGGLHGMHLTLFYQYLIRTYSVYAKLF